VVNRMIVGIPACNEEESINSCLEAVLREISSLKTAVLVCLNGCTDRTEKKVLEIKRRNPNVDIRILHSQAGLAFALNAIVDAAKAIDPQAPLALVDADVVLSDGFLEIVHEELERNSDLLIVGGWPMPNLRKDISRYRLLLQKILHARALYPEAEISVHDVSAFKRYVMAHPQPDITPEAEARSKIYFHGRCYVLRSPSYFNMPANKDVVDDTYLSNYIHTNFGPGTIRIRYDALAFYKPIKSLREHFFTYWRYFLDKKNLDHRHKEFKVSRHFEKTKLNWSYINRQKYTTIIIFYMYTIISTLERLCFSVLPSVPVGKLWKFIKTSDSIIRIYFNNSKPGTFI